MIRIAQYLLTRESLFCAFFALIQQVLVGISTYALIEGVKQNQVTLIALFFVCLGLVYIPSMAAHIFLSRAIIASETALIANFDRVANGKVQLARPWEKQRSEAWIVSQGPQLLHNFAHTLYDVLTASCNVIFNALILGHVFHYSIAWAFLGSSIIVVIAVLISRNSIAACACAEQIAKNQVATLRLSAWDTIAVANHASRERWLQQFMGATAMRKFSERNAILAREGVSFASSAAALILLALVNLYLLRGTQDNSSAAIVASFPRQVQLVQFIFQIAGRILELQSLFPQARLFEQFLETLKGKDSNFYPNWEKLTVNHQTAMGLDHILKQLNHASTGRLTIRGENGAGKTLVLETLKERLGRNAEIYLNHCQDFRDHIGSQGQRVMANLHRLNTKLEARYVLLDEWDAHLDSENRMLADSILSRLKEKCWIIETLH